MGLMLPGGFASDKIGWREGSLPARGALLGARTPAFPVNPLEVAAGFCRILGAGFPPLSEAVRSTKLLTWRQ